MNTRILLNIALSLVLGILAMSAPSETSAKRILFCIDGTRNDPGDARDEYDELGMLEDQSISNVLKLHLLAGGQLDNTHQPDPEQLSFYYIGVGNRALTSVYGKLSAALAIREPKKILEEATKDLEEYYRPGDTLYIFGFSRGAAIARWFAQRIYEQGVLVQGSREHPNVRFLGVWDTVAAFGGPNMDTSRQPSTTELTEKSGRIAPNIEEAYHLVSIDDPRIAFRPTLMGAEERVTEIWFPGIHSDVGGGYLEDGLSDIALDFMIETARKAGVVFKQLQDIGDALGPIEPERVAIKPESLGTLHLKPLLDDNAYKTWLHKWRDILDLRKIYVAHGDRESDGAPLIHYTAFERRDNRNAQYDPPNLKALGDNYQIVAADGSIREPH